MPRRSTATWRTSDESPDRSADRPAQPRGAQRAPGTGSDAPAPGRRRSAAGGAGHRPLQADQRRLRPPGRGQGAEDHRGELRKRLRQADFIARFGGEEFVVLLPATSLEAGRQLLERLRAAIAACPFHFRASPEHHLFRRHHRVPKATRPAKRFSSVPTRRCIEPSAPAGTAWKWPEGRPAHIPTTRDGLACRCCRGS